MSVRDWRSDFRTWRANVAFQQTAQDSDSRPITRLEERRYSKKVCHEWSLRRASSCNRVFRYVCWRCFLRDITGTTRRQRAAYIIDFRRRAGEARARMEAEGIPPLVMVRNAEGRWVRKDKSA